MRFIFSELNSMDEIWNYQFSRRILHGQVPYKDFFLLTTPLSAQINSIFLHFFGDNLLVLRIIMAFLATINFVIIYAITYLTCKKNNLSLLVGYIYISLIFFYPQNNYSWFAVLFLSFSLLFETIKFLSREKFIVIIELLIGTFIGFTFITKQNIGIFGLFISTVFLFYLNQTSNRSFLTTLKYASFKIAGFSLVVFFEFIYLYQNNALYKFYDQAIIGPIGFSNEVSISYYKFILSSPFFIKIIASIIPLTIVLILFSSIFKTNSEQKSLQILFCLYAIANFSAIFPLADIPHLLFSLSLSGIPILYYLLNKFFIVRVSDNFDHGFFFTIIISFILLNIILMPHDTITNHNIKHYKWVPLSKNAIRRIKVMGKYVEDINQEGYSVKFLNFRAPFYFIPLNIFNYKSDTMFKGNMGTSGADCILRNISKEKNFVAIIRGKEMPINRQESLVFENYIRDNMLYIENIEGYDIYKKN